MLSMNAESVLHVANAGHNLRGHANGLRGNSQMFTVHQAHKVHQAGSPGPGLSSRLLRSNGIHSSMSFKSCFNAVSHVPSGVGQVKSRMTTCQLKVSLAAPCYSDKLQPGVQYIDRPCRVVCRVPWLFMMGC